MAKLKLFILFMSFILFSTITLAENFQQSNKLFLSPFYVASMTQNVDYRYNVSVITPDKVSSIKSAILTLDAWINPTRTAFAWVNDIACNTPSYVISTTYAGAGRGVFTFDCSNAVRPNAVNNVTFRITGGNIGSSTAWLDLTYTNDLSGTINVKGTEYVGGDLGKIFLQYLDTNKQPVTNSECFVKVWYPNNTIMYNDSLMYYLDDGIYYKNLNVPNTEGVYPISAKCFKPLSFSNTIIYGAVSDNFESNTWTGGTGWSSCPLGDPNCQNGWDVENTVPLSTLASTGCYAGTYCAKYTGSYGWIERGFLPYDGTEAVNISFAIKFSGFQTNEQCEFFIFDGNWHLIERIGKINGFNNNQWYVRTHYLPATSYEMDNIMVYFGTYNAPSTGDECFIDNVAIDFHAPNISISNTTEYEVLRGNGEMHVSSLYTKLTGNMTSNINLTTEQIWNYPSRNLTYYPPQVDLTNYTRIDETIYAVNDSVSGSIEQAKQNVTGEVALVPNRVWNDTERTLTFYEDKTNYTKVGETVWNWQGTLTDNILSQIATKIWNWVARYTHGEDRS